MRQAEPAVCALAQLGEAQILLAQALAQSPFPPRLNADQRKLYRAALAEKAQPIYGEARETLASADAMWAEDAASRGDPQQCERLCVHPTLEDTDGAHECEPGEGSAGSVGPDHCPVDQHRARRGNPEGGG